MISLSHKLFNEDPYEKFGQIHHVSPTIWVEMYQIRYKKYEYEINILAEYFNLKTGKNINERTIRRWVKRTDIYHRAQYAIQLGAQNVSPDFFSRVATHQELLEYGILD